MIKDIFADLIILIGKIRWEKLTALLHGGRYYEITHEDHQKILDVLERGNYFILTRRNSHLSTYTCAFANWWLTGQWGYWSHLCMNVESESEDLFDKVKILESIGS